MFRGTFTEIAEVASKKYNKDARMTLEESLQQLTLNITAEITKQLGLPQVLMFFSSTIAKSNDHKIIEAEDVHLATAFLKYVLSRDLVENLIIDNRINLGLPANTKKDYRIRELLQIKGNMKIKNNLDGKIERLVSFLQEHNLEAKDVRRIELEIRATILLLARIITHGRRGTLTIANDDIDKSYDIMRFMIFKLDSTLLRVLFKFYLIDNKTIWSKIPKITVDQSAHDHLGKTAYGRWESNLPQTFEALKKKINCSIRPFMSAIVGFSEIFAAKKQVSRIGSQELMHILDEFEQVVFDRYSPMIVEQFGIDFTFTKEGLELLSTISSWITEILISAFGKDEYVFNFSSTIPRQISLLLFISLVERIKNKAEKITTKHIAQAIDNWTEQLLLLQSLPQE
jgi:hypothetical protein